MLILARKKGQIIYIGASPLLIDEIYTDYLHVTFRNIAHQIPKGVMYTLSPETTICFIRKATNEAKLQFLSSLPIKREEIYGPV